MTDPWGEVVSRLGTGPDAREEDRPGPRQEGESERAVKDAQPPKSHLVLTRRPFHMHVRLLVVVAACVFLGALLRVALPAVLGGDKATTPGAASPNRSAHRATPHRPQRVRAKDPALHPRGPRHAGQRARSRPLGVSPRRRRHGHHEPGARMKATRASSPVDRDISGTPPVPTVPEWSPPEEPAPPPAQQPRGGEGLVDGSRSSAEFGL
jgi:hypothetical protein